MHAEFSSQCVIDLSLGEKDLDKALLHLLLARSSRSPFLRNLCQKLGPVEQLAKVTTDQNVAKSQWGGYLNKGGGGHAGGSIPSATSSARRILDKVLDCAAGASMLLICCSSL